VAGSGAGRLGWVSGSGGVGSACRWVDQVGPSRGGMSRVGALRLVRPGPVCAARRRWPAGSRSGADRVPSARPGSARRGGPGRAERARRGGLGTARPGSARLGTGSARGRADRPLPSRGKRVAPSGPRSGSAPLPTRPLPVSPGGAGRLDSRAMVHGHDPWARVLFADMPARPRRPSECPGGRRKRLRGPASECRSATATRPDGSSDERRALRRPYAPEQAGRASGPLDQRRSGDFLKASSRPRIRHRTAALTRRTRRSARHTEGPSRRATAS
jgi:hypothetical protein